MHHKTSNSGRILIIDDNRAIHEDFRKILNADRSGNATLAEREAALFGEPASQLPHQPQFELDSAYQGQEGVVLMQDSLHQGRPYTMAFVDVRIPPGWDGVETSSRLWEIAPDLQIVICTAYADYSWHEMIERLGYSDRWVILKKPFDPVEVLQLANALTEKVRLLHKARARQEEIEQQVRERTNDLALANEALRESEERFRSIFEQAAVGIAGVALDGKLLRFNEKFREITGRSKEELLSLSFQDITHPDDLEREMKLYREFLSGETRVNTLEKRYVVKGRPDVWARLTASIIRDASGQPDNILAVIEDITERKRMEKERAELATAIDQAGESVVIWNEQGSIQYINPAFESASGYSRDEVLGHNIGMMICRQYNDSALKYNISEVLVRGENWQGHIVAPRKNGSIFTVETMVSPVKDSLGKIQCYVSVSRDITKELQMEAQLRQAQKMEAVGQLAGGIAHDFNNLMQVILGNVEFLQGCQTDGIAKQRITEVKKAAERAADLTRQLLTYSRRQVMQPVNLDINDLIQGLLKMLYRVIGEHIELCFVPGHRLARTHVDKGQMEQALMNLCLNARDAMSQGGKLTVTTENVTIDEEYCSEHTWATVGQYVLVRVADTGHGMDAATLSHIFEPFFTTKGVGQGTGLGLAMVFGIIKQHDGLILVKSEVGVGSVFNVYLPAVEISSKEVTSKAVARGPVSGGKETILVAEDESAVLELVAMVLRTAGYNVLTASDGNDAMRVYEMHHERIDLVMLDVVMPGISGKDVMDQIQAKNPNMPFLFSSGYSESTIHADFVLHDEINLLQKPYSTEDLLAEVRRIIDTHRNQENI